MARKQSMTMGLLVLLCSASATSCGNSMLLHKIGDPTFGVFLGIPKIQRYFGERHVLAPIESAKLVRRTSMSISGYPFYDSLESSCLFWPCKSDKIGEQNNGRGSAYPNQIERFPCCRVGSPTSHTRTVMCKIADLKSVKVPFARGGQHRTCVNDGYIVRETGSRITCSCIPVETRRPFTIKKPAKPTTHELFGFFSHSRTLPE